MSAPDPYRTLGVRAGASDEEVRAAYHKLVQLHHPDHNAGSAESAQRFKEVQEAYSRVRELRASRPRSAGTARTETSGSGSGSGSASPGDPGLEERLAKIESELRAAKEARDRALREARAAAARAAREAGVRRPSDEELGYVTTDDSLSKILDDVASQIADRFTEARHSQAADRVADLLDDLGSKLNGEPPKHGH